MRRMKEMRLLFAFIALLLGGALFSGCGNATKESGGEEDIVPIEDAANVGRANCQICHSALTHINLSGVAGINPSPSGLANAITHDCEACHGGGQYHFGSGPMPYPSPGGDRCATCHEQATKVLASKHNAEDAENFSMIADGHDTGKCQRCHTAEGSRTFATIIGAKTAYDVIYSYGATPTAGQTTEALPNLDADGNRILHNPVCAACHNPLTKELVTIAGWDPNGNGSADQFDLCTSCHVYNLNNNGTLIGSGQTYTVSTGAGADLIWFTGDDTLSAGTATAEFYHNTSWYRIIASTHFDNPDSTSVVEGYVIRKNGANPCFDCHGHELHTNTRYADTTDTTRDATPTIYTDWSQSAHAGGLLSNKYAVARTAGVNESGTATLTDNVMGVGVTDTEIGNAWVHYNWDDNSTRSACQMCHTATGAANFMSNPAGYLPADNDYSHLSTWNATGGSPQNELLYCWACHSDAGEGVLRTPGAITLAYTADGVNPTLPDLGNSNVCVNCHSGRGNMDSLVAPADVNPAGAPVTGGTKTHYLAAGATIFQAQTKVGYMYPGASYVDKSYFAHKSLGCAECHMSSVKSHSYEVVEKDGSDVITAITSAKCVECHDGEHALFVGESLVGQVADIWNGSAAVPTTVTQAMVDAAAAELEHEAHGYHDALAALAATLTAAGTPPQVAYPYFGGASTDQGHGGAMHNYSYLHHESGAYAHNRYYAKRLIFDSIDWLTNADGSPAAAGARVLNGSITLSTGTYAAAIAWLGGDAGTGVIAVRP